jgi:hypothetical protein
MPDAAAAHRRDFDFQIGAWGHHPVGVGNNLVEPVIDGFALREQWNGRGGILGTSYSAYDAARDVWHQTWIDTSGSLLLLEGGLRDSAMVLEGSETDARAETIRQRITWSVVNGDPASVGQLWESSVNGGEAWTTAFDGRYSRR